eukprot:6174202-Pleurochrysis_carterae.AAC.1
MPVNGWTATIRYNASLKEIGPLFEALGAAVPWRANEPRAEEGYKVDVESMHDPVLCALKQRRLERAYAVADCGAVAR